MKLRHPFGYAEFKERAGARWYSYNGHLMVKCPNGTKTFPGQRKRPVSIIGIYEPLSRTFIAPNANAGAAVMAGEASEISRQDAQVMMGRLTAGERP